MIICGQQFDAGAIRQIDELIKDEPDLSRRELSRRVCTMMDWRRPGGELADMSCRKALAKLHRCGLLTLPAVRGSWAFQKPAAREAVCPEHAAFTGTLAELGRVEVVPVGSRVGRVARDWNALMDRYHPLGRGPLCGAQMRYVIRSEHRGLLGGLSFSAAAWQLSARDRFIGWTRDALRANLALVVCNSRFLIVPDVRVPHLASHVLGQCARRLRADWLARYGYSPVLAETFVDAAHWAGTCYRAAGWIELGRTAGRGRQDRNHAAGGAIKMVFVKPLANAWQQTLCRRPDGEVVIVPPRKPPEDWAEEEFGDADLGDERLVCRLQTLARQFWGKPTGPITLACGPAGAKGAYRFFSNGKTSMDKILDAHIEATVRRVQEHPLVLVPQDTTSLNYTAHPATEGIGPIQNVESSAASLELHSGLAFTPDGTPLGLLHAACWARDAEPRDKAGIKAVPIEDKESFKWILGYRALAAIQKRCRKTHLVSMTDREGDVYELFAEARAAGAAGPGLIVRQERSRRRAVAAPDDAQQLLWDAMSRLPVGAVVDITIARHPGKPARTARTRVRFGPVKLQPPRDRKHLGEVAAWAVYVREEDPPSDGERLEWMLVTNLPTDTCEIAIERTQQYGNRWGIEVFHRTLKSGCRMEDRQLHNAKRLETCLAIDMVVAWRIFYLAMLGRETPDVPCTVFFQDDEWRALVCFTERNPEPPPAPPTLREASAMVGRLGGFLGRKRDGDPGTECMWRGLQRLDDITMTWQVLSPYATGKMRAVSEDDYG